MPTSLRAVLRECQERGLSVNIDLYPSNNIFFVRSFRISKKTGKPYLFKSTRITDVENLASTIRTMILGYSH